MNHKTIEIAAAAKSVIACGRAAAGIPNLILQLPYRRSLSESRSQFALVNAKRLDDVPFPSAGGIRTIIIARFSAGFAFQAYFLDRYAFIQRFAHIIDGKGGH